MSRTPNYVTTIATGELPEGAFVRPIQLEYLPKDWKDYVKGAAYFDPQTEYVCYTRLGLRIIPKYQVRQS